MGGARQGAGEGGPGAPGGRREAGWVGSGRGGGPRRGRLGETKGRAWDPRGGWGCEERAGEERAGEGRGRPGRAVGRSRAAQTRGALPGSFRGRRPRRRWPPLAAGLRVRVTVAGRVWSSVAPPWWVVMTGRLGVEGPPVAQK